MVILATQRAEPSTKPHFSKLRQVTPIHSSQRVDSVIDPTNLPSWCRTAERASQKLAFRSCVRVHKVRLSGSLFASAATLEGESTLSIRKKA